MTIPQPMVRYDNYDELITNEDITKINIVISFPQLLQLLSDKKIALGYDFMRANSMEYQRPILDLNIWIKTVDKYVPDTANTAGDIVYVKENGEAVSTEGCYVRLYYIVSTPIKSILFCSTGINSVGITKWQVTGAVRCQFYMETNNRLGHQDPARYAAYLNKITTRVKPTVDMYKFVYALLTPNSPHFLDVNKAATFAYASRVKSPDRNELLKSPAFRGAAMQILKLYVPELKSQIKADFPADKVVAMLTTAYGIAVENKKVDDILKVYKEVREVGYEESQAITDNRLPDIPLIDESSTGKPKEITLGSNAVSAEELARLNEEAFDLIRQDLDYPDGFISNVNEVEEDNSEFISNIK